MPQNKRFLRHFLRGGGNPKRVHFVLRNRALRFIFSEHFVLRIIYCTKPFRPPNNRITHKPIVFL